MWPDSAARDATSMRLLRLTDLLSSLSISLVTNDRIMNIERTRLWILIQSGSLEGISKYATRGSPGPCEPAQSFSRRIRVVPFKLFVPAEAHVERQKTAWRKGDFRTWKRISKPKGLKSYQDNLAHPANESSSRTVGAWPKDGHIQTPTRPFQGRSNLRVYDQ